MTTETQTTNPIKTKPRRWIRFRLRTLLIILTLLSVPLCWVGWELDQRRKEKAVVAWVEEMGGEVVSNSSSFRFFYNVESILPIERNWWEKTTDKWFGERVRFVIIYSTQVSDLSHLAELKKLEYLELYDTQVSDLSPLAELMSLEALCLESTNVSDLSPLAALKNLEFLDLRDTQVNDLSPLAGLKNLEMLYLKNTQVSDLSPLCELKNLEFLSLSGTQVSREQVEELKLALPNCKIYF